MQTLSREDLYGLEDYATRRDAFRARVMAHKKHRLVQVGEHAGLYFEDRLTMHYQVQEMLRAERIFEAQAIDEELETYNPLIPDGTNWKVTFMIEYADAEERQVALEKMVGVEDCVWVQVEGHDKVWAIADEDLERANEHKTSAVHFLRFELLPDMVTDAKAGSAINMGINHDAYDFCTAPVADDIRASLVADLD